MEIQRFYPDEYYGEPGTKFQPLVESLVRWVGQRTRSALAASGTGQGLSVQLTALDRLLACEPVDVIGLRLHFFNLLGRGAFGQCHQNV